MAHAVDTLIALATPLASPASTAPSAFRRGAPQGSCRAAAAAKALRCKAGGNRHPRRAIARPPMPCFFCRRHRRLVRRRCRRYHRLVGADDNDRQQLARRVAAAEAGRRRRRPQRPPPPPPRCHSELLASARLLLRVISAAYTLGARCVLRVLGADAAPFARRRDKQAGSATATCSSTRRALASLHDLTDIYASPSSFIEARHFVCMSPSSSTFVPTMVVARARTLAA